MLHLQIREVPLWEGEGKTPAVRPSAAVDDAIGGLSLHLSERQVEELANFYLLVRCFLGLGADEGAPDHAILPAFKNRLVENGRLEAFERVLSEVLRRLGTVQIVDSVHTVAAVNMEKDGKRQEKEGKPPRDPHAQWGVKGWRYLKDEEGWKVKRRDYFCGYKAHVSLNAESGLITSLVHTSGDAHDGQQLPVLVEKDLV